VKGKSYSGSKYWLLVLDDCTDHIWSYFPTAKSHTKTVLTPLLKELLAKHGKVVKDILCDNAGENKALEKKCQVQGLGIQFEYTAPGTPQHNGHVERKFATLYGRAVRSMLNEANLKQSRRTGIWTEAARTATLLDTILVLASKPEASYSAFF
jgi:transposase InsO family protein